MTKAYLIVILLCVFSQSIWATGLSITFAEKSQNVIGISPFLRDIDMMYQYALEQGAIFATKLQESFCIFRQASLEREYDDKEDGETVVFSVNVVSDFAKLLENLETIECVHSIDFEGYIVAIWTLGNCELGFFNTEDEDDIGVSIAIFDDDLQVDTPQIEVNDTKVVATSTAKHTYLDIALDDAFQYALTEISKYQDQHIKNMNRSIISFSEQALLVEAENIVSDVHFSKVMMQCREYDGLSTYFVTVTLTKDR